jgi:predicted secreted Zn-dependent protease
MKKVNPLRNLFLVLLILPFVIAQSSAQDHISKDIPLIDLSFFKGAIPENSAFASTTFIDYSYKFAIERNTRTNQVKVRLNMTIVPNSEKSFFDVSRVDKGDIRRLINHEQGHIVIGFIIGKKVEDALNAVSYTANYKEEIRINYQKFYARFEKMQFDYDKETRHGADLEAQTKWNKKIRLLSKEV